MLQGVNQLYKRRLSASDGDVGHVVDLYFDDRLWVVRYVVVDTGSWLAGRQVLISPHICLAPAADDDAVHVRVTRAAIEGSPSIDAHKPVSRRYEEEYYRYYGIPYYWEGNGLWGLSDIPIMGLPKGPPPSDEAASRHATDALDAYLRSTQAMHGYHLEAADGPIGELTDMLLDAEPWIIRHLVVRTGLWFFGKEVEIPADRVAGIDTETSSVAVRMDKEAVRQSREVRHHQEAL